MRFILLAILVLLPQLASAKVYMCVDEATGKRTFTDRACDASTLGEEVRVDRTNLDSGRPYGREARDKSWNSERESRQSGLEYSANRRQYLERQTARID